MDGIAFENLVAAKMRGFGWQCLNTPASNDFGADVICTLGTDKLVIQCKCYADNCSVGGDAVREAYAAVAHFGANNGLVVYQGSLTKQARLLGKSTGVDLFHLNELKPGFKFDRTDEGAEARRQEEREQAELRMQQHKERIYEEHMVLQREAAAYRKDLAEVQRENAEWGKAKKRHGSWQSAAAFACLVALFTWGEPQPGAAIAWAALIFAGYAYFGTSPGSRPQPPTKPHHVIVEKTKPEIVRVKSGGPAIPKAAEPDRVNTPITRPPRPIHNPSAPFTITRTVARRCPHCGGSFSVTLHRHEEQTRCPHCVGLVEAPRTV